MNSKNPLRELTSLDGAHFTGYAAQAKRPGGIGIVILPGGRGLEPIYTDMADHFATAGVHAIAIDHFGRTAGLGIRDEKFGFAPHLRQTSSVDTASDVAAAIRFLRSETGGSAEAIFTIGFSFGGAASILQAAENHDLSGAIGFYGWPVTPDQDFQHWPAPISLVSQYKVPILAIFGGADARIPSEQATQFQQALNKAGVGNRLVVYPDAGHGFFDRGADQFPREANQARAEVMAHMATYIPPVTNVAPARSGVLRARHGGRDHFRGNVWIAELQSEQPAGSANIYRVLFEPGARTAWHRHPGGQILSVITGRGKVGNNEGVQDIEAGDLIFTRPCERHWHGSTAEDLMVHLAINPVNGETEWEKHATEVKDK